MKPTQFAEPIELTEPADEDLLFIVQVLQEQATPEQVAEYDRRYADDDAFRLKAGPLVEFWLADVDIKEIIAEAQGQGAAVAIPGVEATPAPRQKSYDAPPALPDSPKAGKPSSLKDFRYIAGRTLLAAGIAFVVYVGYQVATFFEDQPDGVVAVTKVVPNSYDRARTAGAGATEATSFATPEPGRSSMALIYILDMNAKPVRTDSTEMKTVELRGGSRIRLRPRSGLRHGKIPGLPFGAFVELNGEMTIDVTNEDEIVNVISRAGTAMLGPGSYALRCQGACAALELSVGRGSASLKPDVLEMAPVELQLQAGEWGRAFRNAPAVRVSADSAQGFPVLRSNFRGARAAAGARQ